MATTPRTVGDLMRAQCPCVGECAQAGLDDALRACPTRGELVAQSGLVYLCPIRTALKHAEVVSGLLQTCGIGLVDLHKILPGGPSAPYREARARIIELTGELDLPRSTSVRSSFANEVSKRARDSNPVLSSEEVQDLELSSSPSTAPVAARVQKYSEWKIPGTLVVSGDGGREFFQQAVVQQCLLGRKSYYVRLPLLVSRWGWRGNPGAVFGVYNTQLMVIDDWGMGRFPEWLFNEIDYYIGIRGGNGFQTVLLWGDVGEPWSAFRFEREKEMIENALQVEA